MRRVAVKIRDETKKEAVKVADKEGYRGGLYQAHRRGGTDHRLDGGQRSSGEKKGMGGSRVRLGGGASADFPSGGSRGKERSSRRKETERGDIQDRRGDNKGLVAKACRKTKRGHEKIFSSLVIELSTPEGVNEIVQKGLVGGGSLLTCERWEREQCYRCFGYGHKAPQCSNEMRCGTCSEGHDSTHHKPEDKRVRCPV